MIPIQQIPSAKIVVLHAPGNFDQRFVLCYSASMGYYIAEYPNPEDIVICTESRARRMAGTFGTTSRILYIDRSGQEGLVYVKSSEVMEMGMTIKEPKTETGQYRFVNGEGNYIRFSGKRGFHIDANSPADIYYVETAAEAEEMQLKFNTRGYLFEDMHCNTVDSNITIFFVNL